MVYHTSTLLQVFITGAESENEKKINEKKEIKTNENIVDLKRATTATTKRY